MLGVPEKRLDPLPKKVLQVPFLSRANVTLLVFYSVEKWTRSVKRQVLNFSWSYTRYLDFSCFVFLPKKKHEHADC